MDIFIDGQLCGTTNVDTEFAQWETVKCPDGGLKGSNISFNRKPKGYLAFCGIKVHGESGYETDQDCDGLDCIQDENTDGNPDGSDSTDGSETTEEETPGTEPDYDSYSNCDSKIQELEDVIYELQNQALTDLDQVCDVKFFDYYFFCQKNYH